MTETHKKVKGATPNYKVKVFDRTTKRSAVVGAAWVIKNGSISISLNLCTVLKYDDNIAITLFPSDETDFPYGNNMEETEGVIRIEKENK